jgi:hypothetical protein
MALFFLPVNKRCSGREFAVAGLYLTKITPAIPGVRLNAGLNPLTEEHAGNAEKNIGENLSESLR